ncbi:MAG: response regulator transcription factor [Chloroflexi bacterium]|jgi:DNA-binding response OmpR family regulator|nr:response regulator transcription factor [Anaerolineaceae bacterium]NMB89821.1 response regulator transcription factor [Chloroflexota bacterium]
MRSSGKRICQSIHQKYPGLPILMVLEEGSDPATRTDADVALVLPFTLQKLLNRIRPLLPNDDEDVMKVGPLELNTEQRWVRLRNRQAQLTPRLVILLKALMERPGEVIERSDLFRLVWDTAYIGDTRTLDVHISWLRQAVEDDPRHPKLIKTVRGYGYRLDVEASANPETRPLKPVEAPAVDLSPETHN